MTYNISGNKFNTIEEKMREFLDATPFIKSRIFDGLWNNLDNQKSSVTYIDMSSGSLVHDANSDIISGYSVDLKNTHGVVYILGLAKDTYHFDKSHEQIIEDLGLDITKFDYDKQTYSFSGGTMRFLCSLIPFYNPVYHYYGSTVTDAITDNVRIVTKELLQTKQNLQEEPLK